MFKKKQKGIQKIIKQAYCLRKSYPDQIIVLETPNGVSYCKLSELGIRQNNANEVVLTIR